MTVGGPIEQLALPYDPTRPGEKVARRRRLVRGRVISLVITLVLMAVIYLWQRDAFGTALWVIYGLTLLVSLAWLAVTVVGYLRARSELASVGQGLAVRIGRPGVEVAGSFSPWPDVVGLRIVTSGLGRSPLLRLDRHSQPPATVPLDQLDVFPATLDTTVRAYSAGRFGVDLSALDN